VDGQGEELGEGTCLMAAAGRAALGELWFQAWEWWGWLLRAGWLGGGMGWWVLLLLLLLVDAGCWMLDAGCWMLLLLLLLLLSCSDRCCCSCVLLLLLRGRAVEDGWKHEAHGLWLIGDQRRIASG
jgi:hypothetical protein